MTPFGHDAQVQAFLSARATGRLHHAWLLAGPRGVGKGTFARAAARRLLADAAGPRLEMPGFDVPDDHRIAHLWRAGSHPDMMLLERLYREKTKDVARSISVEQVRGLSRLFATVPSYSPVRTVIVDAAEDMEGPGANALLKILEEPPAETVFFLITHTPQRLLPTIRSRCRALAFSRIDDAAMTSALRRALPDADDREIAALVAAGEGAPGEAVAHAGLDVDTLDRAIDRLVKTGDATNAERVALAAGLAGKAAQPRYEAFLQRVPRRIARHARTLDGPPLADAIRAWEQARDISANAVRLSLDPQATVFELGSLLSSLAPRPQ